MMGFQQSAERGMLVSKVVTKASAVRGKKSTQVRVKIMMGYGQLFSYI